MCSELNSKVWLTVAVPLMTLPACSVPGWMEARQGHNEAKPEGEQGLLPEAPVDVRRQLLRCCLGWYHAVYWYRCWINPSWHSRLLTMAIVRYTSPVRSWALKAKFVIYFLCGTSKFLCKTWFLKSPTMPKTRTVDYSLLFSYSTSTHCHNSLVNS